MLIDVTSVPDKPQIISRIRACHTMHCTYMFVTHEQKSAVLSLFA